MKTMLNELAVLANGLEVILCAALGDAMHAPTGRR
jgi:hypothetical protein